MKNSRDITINLKIKVCRRIFPRSMMKNRIVVIEKSTNKNRTFVLFSCLHLYTFKKMSDIIGTVTRTNSKNMTEPEPGIIRYFRVLFYPQKSVFPQGYYVM